MNDNLSFKNIFKRETKLATYIVICLTIVVLSLSYAMFFKVDGNSKNQVVEAGDLVFTYENSSQTIISEGKESCFMPMSAEETQLYLGTCDYRLSVQNTGSLKGAYTLRLVANAENTIEASKLKVVLRKQEGESFQVVSGYENGKTVSELTDGILIEDEEMEPNSTVVFSVSLIIDESVATDADTSKVLSYKIEGTGLVHESQEIDTVTLAEKMISCAAEGKSGATCLIENANLSAGELVYDETADNNLRYIGANPNNYVSFNNELWRIVGLVNTLEGQKVKIIRDESVGEYSFSEDSSIWASSQLKSLLNDSGYWDGASKTCNYLQADNYTTVPCDFTEVNLSESAKAMITGTTWNLGGTETINISTINLYIYERNNSSVSGSNTWKGNVAVLYPSDYGYATSGGSTTDRDTCLNTDLYFWNTDQGDNYNDCFQNNWLYNPDKLTWLITSTPEGYRDDYATVIGREGGIYYYNLSYNWTESPILKPVVHLISSVKVSGGTGSQDDPYQLHL